MKKSSDIGKREKISEEISNTQGSDSEQEENFVSDVQRHTQKLINEERLDSVGFEDQGAEVLNVWLEEAKAKQEGIPLSGLIERVREISGLMPILKKIQNRQLEQDMFFLRWEQELEDKYLLKTQMDVDFSAFEQLVESRVKNRLDAYDMRVEQLLGKCVT